MPEKASKARATVPAQQTKEGLHPRNRHRVPYNFSTLVKACPELQDHVITAPHGGPSVNFADPEAVKCLNRALLKTFYLVGQWDLPEGFLCPPIPGRADYLHHAADLLSDGVEAKIPRGVEVRVLDIGIGASCVYPLIGHREYGWNFVGTDTDLEALDWAADLLAANRSLRGHVELRHQPDRAHIFQGILRPGERFALSICNPPFHASAAEAAQASDRKQRNLAKGGKPSRVLNFGGRQNELWCPGGERSFVRRMIQESASVPTACGWFTTLVSKSENLPYFEDLLKRVKAVRVRKIDMAQGQKKSRLLAWSFEA